MRIHSTRASQPDVNCIVGFLCADLEGGDVTISDIQLKAQGVCATPNTDQPFMCLDITYIALLLEEGFGLTHQTKVKVSEVRWQLSAMYNRNISLPLA